MNMRRLHMILSRLRYLPSGVDLFKYILNKIISVNGKGYQNFRELWYQNNAPKFCDKCHFIDMKPIKR